MDAKEQIHAACIQQWRDPYAVNNVLFSKASASNG